MVDDDKLDFRRESDPRGRDPYIQALDYMLVHAAAASAEHFERYCDWLAAATGAAFLFLAQGQLSSARLTPEALSSVMYFLAFSLVFAGWAKLLGFYVRSGLVGATMSPKVMRALRDATGESFPEARKKFVEGLFFRMRIPGRFMAWWGAKVGKKDSAGGGRLVNAAAMYAACSIFCQMLCILNAAERVALGVK